MANDCAAGVQACFTRVTRLDGAGVPTPTSTSMYVTDQLIKLTMTPEIVQGDEFEQKNACGVTVVNFRDCDRVKRLTGTIEFSVPDPQLTEMLTTGTVITNGAATGYAYPTLNDPNCDLGESVEVWVKRIISGAQDTVYPWWWWVFPRTFWQIGPQSFENAIQTRQLNGWANENANWSNGPTNNWPAASTKVAQYLPTAYTPTVMCAYQAVPAT